MKRDGWHTQDSPGRHVHARHWPPRFDLAVEARFPPLHPARLARQVRQDMWRALQDLRGFSPAVEIEVLGDGLRLRAGGAVAGRVSAAARARLEALLEDPQNRARWARWAKLRRS